MKTTEAPVVIEQTFNASPENVWNAITKLSEMTQWFFENIREFEPVTGFETDFIIQSNDRVFPHLWKIIEVIPQKKITYDWRYEGYSGTSIVEFDLVDTGEQTKLILTATVTEDFDNNIPEFQRESCEAGWNYLIKGRLMSYLTLKE
jgi:uncharacterized protein YndB with AHSA1/START domain